MTLELTLLAEKDLTLDNAIATAQSSQVAGREAREMAPNTSSPSEGTIDAIHQSSGRKPQSKASYRKNAECNACHRTGHLARVCSDKH